jgi:hypothetical protein
VSKNKGNQSNLELAAMMFSTSNFMVLNFESFDGITKNSEDDNFRNLAFPVEFSVSENSLGSPEGHKNETNWHLKESDNSDIIRESKLVSCHKLCSFSDA